MKWLRMLTPVVAAAGLITAIAVPAQASENSGWVYTTNHSGAAFFDADLNGYPGVEKLTVCDNKSDGRGIEARIEIHGQMDTLKDPSNDGKCESMAYNMGPEENEAYITVWEYWGSNSDHGAVGIAIS